ncbi:MAG: alpha/beta hydrolase [Bacteroidota bacterium]
MKLFRLVSFLLLLSPVINAQESNLLEHHDVPYLPADQIEVDSLQRLNLIIPLGVKNPPLLIWVGGGAWAFVDRNIEMELCKKIAQSGIAVASVGHRLSTARWVDSTRTEGVQHPAHTKDLAAATRWLFEKADDYGYDPDQIFVGGFSSGAYIATILMADHQFLTEKERKQIRGILPIAGTFDIQHYHDYLLERRPVLAKDHVMAVFGDTQDLLKQASVTEYMDNLEWPLLLMTDKNLKPYTKHFIDRLKAESDFSDYKYVVTKEYGHRELWEHLSKSEESKYRQMMVDFILGTKG